MKQLLGQYLYVAIALVGLLVTGFLFTPGTDTASACLVGFGAYYSKLYGFAFLLLFLPYEGCGKRNAGENE